MKRISSYAAALAILGGFSVSAAAQAPAGGSRIGVIEVQRIVQESAIGKESLARVQKLQGAKQDELTRRQKELRDLEQKIQDQGKSLSEDAMEKAQKDYQAKALELKRAQDDAQRELEESQRKELAELERRVMPVIESVAKDQGFQLIFNKFQSGLLHADSSIDITDAVIAKFNTQIASAPASKPAAGAPAPAAKKPAPATTATPKK